MPNEQPDSNPELFPPIAALSRKRQAEEKRKERQLANIFGSNDSPDRKKKVPQNSSQAPPPGFINPNLQNNSFADSCVEFIRDFVVKMNLPPFLYQFFEQYAIPFIRKTVIDITNSVNQNVASWMTQSQI